MPIIGIFPQHLTSKQQYSGVQTPINVLRSWFGEQGKLFFPAPHIYKDITIQYKFISLGIDVNYSYILVNIPDEKLATMFMLKFSEYHPAIKTEAEWERYVNY